MTEPELIPDVQGANDEVSLDPGSVVTRHEGDVDAPTEPAAPVFRVMNVESVTFSLGDASPHVHLMEAEIPFRHLSVPIALPEAQALHAAMNNVTGRRPATHELASSILRQFQADIISVHITRYEEGVYYAQLDVMTPRGPESFDARPSDAFILALRQAVSAPILCAEEVLDLFFV
jgi:bifunctional DNase/RNase